MNREELIKIKELLLSNDSVNHQLAIQLYKSCVGDNFIEFYVDEVLGFDDELFRKNKPVDITVGDNSRISYTLFYDIRLLLEYCYTSGEDYEYYVEVIGYTRHTGNPTYKFFNTREELISFLQDKLKSILC